MRFGPGVDNEAMACLDGSVLTTLTKHGTIGIPKPVRESFALHAGDTLQVEPAPDGRITLTKVSARKGRGWLAVLRACPALLPVFTREHFSERAAAV